MAASPANDLQDDDGQLVTIQPTLIQDSHGACIPYRTRQALRNHLNIQQRDQYKERADPIRLSLQMYITLQLARIQVLFSKQQEEDKVHMMDTLIEDGLYVAEQIQDHILKQRCLVWRCAILSLARYNQPVELAKCLLAAKILLGFDYAESQLLEFLLQKHGKLVKDYTEGLDGELVQECDSFRATNRELSLRMGRSLDGNTIPPLDRDSGRSQSIVTAQSQTPNSSLYNELLEDCEMTVGPIDMLLTHLRIPKSRPTALKLSQEDNESNGTANPSNDNHQTQNPSDRQASKASEGSVHSPRTTTAGVSALTAQSAIDMSSFDSRMIIDGVAARANSYPEAWAKLDGGQSKGRDMLSSSHKASANVEQFPANQSLKLHGSREQRISDAEQMNSHPLLQWDDRQHNDGEPHDQILAVPHPPPRTRSRDYSGIKASISGSARILAVQGFGISSNMSSKPTDLSVEIPPTGISSQERKLSDALSPEKIASRIESTSNSSKSSDATTIVGGGGQLASSNGQSQGAREKRKTSDSVNQPAVSSPLSKAFLPGDVPFSNNNE